jgi:hypothetical protein
MKPIEPGCRAVIVHPNAMGMKCDVIRYCAHSEPLTCWADAGANGWLVDTDNGHKGFFEPAFLIRIDDDQGGNDEVITEVKVTYVAPEGVAVCQ